jgi:hypothetical protein
MSLPDLSKTIGNRISSEPAHLAPVSTCAIPSYIATEPASRLIHQTNSPAGLIASGDDCLRSVQIYIISFSTLHAMFYGTNQLHHAVTVNSVFAAGFARNPKIC